MNYGAAVQKYFGHNTDMLANDMLSETQKALEWDENLVSEVTQSEVDGLERDRTIFTKRTVNMSLEGTLDFNFLFTIDAAAMATAQESGIMRWSQATYDAVGGVLTMKNADSIGSLDLREDGRYVGVYPGVAAKEYKDLVYVCAYVKDAKGDYHYSGVIRYNVATYASSTVADSPNELLKTEIKHMIVYCDAARNYFN